MILHRSRVFKLTPDGYPHVGAWESRCLECNSRYLTDGGWYDAMGEARKHYMDRLRADLVVSVKAGELTINAARLILGWKPLSWEECARKLAESAL
jgi:hypothetical protein